MTDQTIFNLSGTTSQDSDPAVAPEITSQDKAIGASVKGKVYSVNFNKVVKVGSMKLYPLDTHKLPAATLNKIIAEYGEEVVDNVIAIG